MRRYAVNFILLAFLLMTAAARAGEGKVYKVLPQFLDDKGRAALSPSLYERDAYQFYLRKRPTLRTGLQMKVEWRARGVDWTKTMVRAELRGLVTNSLHNVTLEIPVKKSGLFPGWTTLFLTGDKYKNFGELVAWRVTLWEGDRQLSEQKSFLWSGVAPVVR